MVEDCFHEKPAHDEEDSQNADADRRHAEEASHGDRREEQNEEANGEDSAPVRPAAIVEMFTDHRDIRIVFLYYHKQGKNTILY